MDTDAAKQYAALTKRKRELDAELKKVKAEIAKIQEPVIESFIGDGISSVKIDGALISLKTTPRVSAIDHAEAAAWLDGLGLGEMAKRSCNAQTMGAWYRDLIDQDLPIPDGFDDVFKVYEQQSLGVTFSK